MWDLKCLFYINTQCRRFSDYHLHSAKLKLICIRKFIQKLVSCIQVAELISMLLLLWGCLTTMCHKQTIKDTVNAESDVDEDCDLCFGLEQYSAVVKVSVTRVLCVAGNKSQGFYSYFTTEPNCARAQYNSTGSLSLKAAVER